MKKETSKKPLDKLRTARNKRRADDESFSYNPQRLGAFRRELNGIISEIENVIAVTDAVSQVDMNLFLKSLGNSDISDLRGHRHALSIEARSKFKRLLDDIKQHIKAAEQKAAIQ